MALQILSDLKVWGEIAYDVIPGEETGGDDQYRLKPEAEAFIVYGSIVVGMDVLDEKTAEEWLTRLRAWEVVDGPMLRKRSDDGETLVPEPVTMEHLRPFFGTRTNVFPKETKTQFTKRVGRAVMERAGRRN